MYKWLRFCFVIVLLAYTSYTKAQSNQDQCSYINTVLESISYLHYNPKETNEEWSRELWKSFIEDIDPQGFYLIKSNENRLMKESNRIASFIQTGNCDFLNEVRDLYKYKLLQTDTLITRYLNRPFTFSANDSLTTYNNDKIVYAENNTALELRWENWLKYRVLIQLFTAYPKLIDSLGIEKLIQLKEKEARIAVINRHKHKISRTLNRPEGFDKYFRNRFLAIMANSFDPHTEFFSDAEKKDFESDITTETYTFGLEIEENRNGEIEVSDLIPGGPAWKSNEIHKGDILVRLKLPNTKAEDLSLSDETEIEEILNLSTTKRIDLTIRKVNGQLKTVTLLKEKLSAEDNLIKSIILKGAHKIGYISLPGFYTEWNNQKNGCTKDMAKEIQKLKREKIEGLIIDIRFNGGGSMQEAISLAGIFVNEGPISIIEDRNQKPYVLKDVTRGTVYDGPLLILVNGYSASSAEILAAALQDYHRAIIVGTPTYGKSSSQIIYPIDTTSQNNNANSESEASEYIKVTTSKIYRVTGATFQKTGVIPDITLPGHLEFGYRETDSPYALPNDSIAMKVVYTPLVSYPIKELAQLSSSRIGNNKQFQRLVAYNDSLRYFLKNTYTIGLNPKSFYKNEYHFYEMFQRLDSIIYSKTNLYVTDFPSLDKQMIELNPYKKEMNEQIQKKAQNDIYIQECFQILTDFINFKKK
ncbi:MAG TPA: carboxy terminal-processing peptidase [Bacteroidales bacterium]|nr:carboxy terminal-processing peptidase [Bacteroidales bacterium]